jgi:hypothetical protein
MSRRVFLLLITSVCLVISVNKIQLKAQPSPTIRRVLLISVDGLHALDLANFVRMHPHSTLAQLSASGITYTQASTSRPSNSFPGLLSMLTGGSPASTGVWYEGAYARSLSPPGSSCKTIGTEVIWSNALDKNKKLVDAGGGIDPAKLPLDPGKGCTPVYPHNFLKVNTIFEVARSAGMRTAWVDKHPSYEMVNGPSGKGVDDLYTPEIGSSTRDVKGQIAYDDLKVQAILNEINSLDHAGKPSTVPGLFGMTFQSVRFAQVTPAGGYTDASGMPSEPLLEAIDHADQSIGKMVSALKARNLFDSTLIIVTAKHAQAPIDRNKARIVDESIIPKLIDRMQNKLLAFSYADGNITSIWLTDQSQTENVARMLVEPANASLAAIQHVLWGESLKLMTNDPSQDDRIPDIVVIPNFGNMYVPADDKSIAAHGGFSQEDSNVALLVSNPRIQAQAMKTPVETTQIAPTVLKALALNSDSLQAVQKEHTLPLPGLFDTGRFRLK